ncbi:hypothetical protein TWF730_004415 [Orbilia blumenaviensis]|uniref:Uncharacterized protein n=1 Tax=Orbilia blumenaviensis TaxID=1796055 RepID=A0AAV9TY25_9PEZI
MGLQQTPKSSFYGYPTPPPSTPLSLPALPPLASTVNIHITNHNHYSIQTPPDSTKYNFGPKDSTCWKPPVATTSTTPQKGQYKSPLLQRLIKGLAPVYGLLTPAATPVQRSSTVTLVGEESPSAKKQSLQLQQQQQQIDIDTSYRHLESEILQDMPTPAQIRFSASAGNREFAVRQHDDIPSSPVSLVSDDSAIIPEELLVEAIALRKSGNVRSKRAQPKKAKEKIKKIIPKCYNHDLRFPDEDPGVDVVPCDWVRPYNSNRWNDYKNGDVQCKVPKCDVCISHETYGEKSIWALSAPPGHTAESHRLRSRIRYLCSRCPQPAPPPPGGIGPVEMCTCVLRDAQGLPTDMWFQCKGCAESAWLENDAKFGGPDGVLVTKRPRRRKNKYGIIIRPRVSKEARLNGGHRIKRCVCGKICPKDGRYGAWCTWCQCPVSGKDMMEYGGAATKSGRAFLPKEDDGEDDDNEDKMDTAKDFTGKEDEVTDYGKKDEAEDIDMTDNTDRDSGIVVVE